MWRSGGLNIHLPLGGDTFILNGVRSKAINSSVSKRGLPELVHLAVARMEASGQEGYGDVSTPRPSAWPGPGSLKHPVLSDLQMTPPLSMGFPMDSACLLF